MTADLIDFNERRAARGLASIHPVDAFGPPANKRKGCRVRLADGAEGVVWGFRLQPGRSPMLYVTCGLMSFAVPADSVTAIEEPNS